jgi:hypothetical protein
LLIQCSGRLDSNQRPSAPKAAHRRLPGITLDFHTVPYLIGKYYN